MRRGFAGILILGVLGGTGPRATAAAMPAPRLETTSLPDTALSINLGNLLLNTLRYMQIANISDEQEVALGRDINQMLLNQQFQLYDDPQLNQYVDQLGQRLVAASDRRPIPYTFQVIASDEVNAFTIPGGYIYVTTGLIRATDNEAQLAAVLAHEIAHVNQRHNVEAIRQAVLAQGIADTAGLDRSTLARLGYQVAIALPRSREAEFEADELGLRILQQAGYPPIAYVNFLEKLESGGFPPEFLRTHPTSASRIEALRQMIGPDGRV